MHNESITAEPKKEVWEPTRRELLQLSVRALALGVPSSLLTACATAVREEQKFTEPVAGKRTKLEAANFDILPNKIKNPWNRPVFMVNRTWQVAGLYDSSGAIIPLGNDPFKIQAATGQPGHETELGAHSIVAKLGKDHRSSLYEGPDGKGAPMPFALRLKLASGEIDGTAVHGRATTNTQGAVAFASHGCIGIRYEFAEFLHHYLTEGDIVLVV